MNNARQHRAASVTSYMKWIQGMKCVVHSPDLNPNRTCQEVTRMRSCITLQELQGVINRKCALLQQELLDNQIHRMENSLVSNDKACVLVKGEYKPYYLFSVYL